MSRHGAIELDFGDGSYTFRLGLSEIEELESKSDCGIFELLNHFSEARTFRIGMLMNTLRLGLIGGNMLPVEALRMVNKYVDERALDDHRDTAYSVVIMALQRTHGDELIGPAGDEDGEPGKPKDSTSQPSTEAPA